MSTRGAAPAPHPLGLREPGAGMRPRPLASLGLGAGAIREGTKAPGLTGWGRGRGGPGDAVASARRPWGSGGGPGGGVTCVVVVAPEGWRVGTTGSTQRLARAHLWGWGGGRR